MTKNQAGVNLIKHFEGFASKPYQCSADKWTIGFGSRFSPDGVEVTEKTPTITEAEAKIWLLHNLGVIEKHLDKVLKVDLTECQKGAVLSLIYNIGFARFRRSNCFNRLAEGEFDAALKEWAEFRLVNGKVSNGLVRRRSAEIILFNKGN